MTKLNDSYDFTDTQELVTLDASFIDVLVLPSYSNYKRRRRQTKKTFKKENTQTAEWKLFFQTEYSCARIILQMRRTLFQVSTSDCT